MFSTINSALKEARIKDLPVELKLTRVHSTVHVSEHPVR